jgi:hypothetical protein
MTKITTALTSIPLVKDGMASIINFDINTRLDDLFKSAVGIQNKIFNLEITGSDIHALFSSDQFLSSFLLQDSRYLINDINAPKVSYVGSLVLPGNVIEIGRVLALMC